MLRDIDGRSPIARRFRDILRGYEHEFSITTEAERTLARQAATLAVLSEELQAQMARGEPVVAATMVRLAQQLRRVLSDLRQLSVTTPVRVPAQSPTLQDHFAVHADDSDEGDE